MTPVQVHRIVHAIRELRLRCSALRGAIRETQWHREIERGDLLGPLPVPHVASLVGPPVRVTDLDVALASALLALRVACDVLRERLMYRDKFVAPAEAPS